MIESRWICYRACFLGEGKKRIRVFRKDGGEGNHAQAIIAQNVDITSKARF